MNALTRGSTAAIRVRQASVSSVGEIRRSRMSAAAFSAKLGYASAPNTVVLGRAAAEASKPASRISTLSRIPVAMSNRSSTDR